MRRGIIYVGTSRDDPIRVYRRMAPIIVFLYVLHVDRGAHAWDLVYVLDVVEEIWTLAQEPFVALEVNSINLRKR